MADTLLPLAADFPAPDESRWRALVDAALKGGSWDRLTAHTADALPVAPLYREPDIATAEDVSGMPGHAPFIRGARASRKTDAPWLIRQRFAHPDPKQTNADILADLEGGAHAIEIVVDPAGARGVALADAKHFQIALDGVFVDLAPIALDATDGVGAATALATYLKDAGAAACPPAFNIDPIGAMMRVGAGDTADFAAAAALVVRHADLFPGATWVRADGRPVHEAGGSEALELGTALASGIAALRGLTDAKMGVDAAAGAIAFTLAVGPDVLLETAKLRALRLCWARVLEAAGVKAENRAATIHAETSRRMMARHDPWTNMLRVTAAGFAAASGGAQSIATAPFTDALGLPTPFARRLARNVQLVLMEESRLGRVIDPAGGAWYVEKMTRELAACAWKEMQGIEAQGGIVAALANGTVQHEIELVRIKREKAFATRRESITGVTDFPLLGQDVPAVVAPASAGQVSPAKADGARVTPLTPIRWAAPFEALRDKGEAAKARVFCATLGPLAEFSPRANFAKNLFAVGGVDAIGPEEAYKDIAAMVGAFAKSGATVAILCGADARYASEAAPAAQTLKAAGALWIVYAGKPADEAALREAGIDQFVFAGQNALEALATLHAALGIS
jgi:methylmalonyl-CoA mutase